MCLLEAQEKERVKQDSGGAANKEAELATLGNMHVEEDQVLEEDQVCGGGSSLWRSRMGERGCIGTAIK